MASLGKADNCQVSLEVMGKDFIAQYQHQVSAEQPHHVALKPVDAAPKQGALEALDADYLGRYMHSNPDLGIQEISYGDHNSAENGNSSKCRHPTSRASGNTSAAGASTSSGAPEGVQDCRNQTGYIGVRQRKWGMYAAEIRDGDKRRWLGSFNSAQEAGMAYDAAAISQKGAKAKTNFRYLDYASIPRSGTASEPAVRWDLLPKEILEHFPIPSNPGGIVAHPSRASEAIGLHQSLSRQYRPMRGTQHSFDSHCTEDVGGGDVVTHSRKRSRTSSCGGASVSTAYTHSTDPTAVYDMHGYPCISMGTGEDMHLQQPPQGYAWEQEPESCDPNAHEKYRNYLEDYAGLVAAAQTTHVAYVPYGDPISHASILSEYDTCMDAASLGLPMVSHGGPYMGDWNKEAPTAGGYVSMASSGRRSMTMSEDDIYFHRESSTDPKGATAYYSYLMPHQEQYVPEMHCVQYVSAEMGPIHRPPDMEPYSERLQCHLWHTLLDPSVEPAGPCGSRGAGEAGAAMAQEELDLIQAKWKEMARKQTAGVGDGVFDEVLDVLHQAEGT